MQTIKLYENDAYISAFTAEVISCVKAEKHYEVVLDKTAFFPEGGGQLADLGFIGNSKVLDVQIKNNEIVHVVNSPVEQRSVLCKIDWDLRYRRMQNHSGEHLLSGIAHEIYDCNNVGFHMGNEISVDFDKYLTQDELESLETKVNDAIYKNVKIRTEFPSSSELETLDYRSKLELTENVRIVTIEGYDICACCAPHVMRTGEIGLVKIISSMKHRGGVRLQILCGADAFEDYRIKAKNLYEIAVRLCAKRNHELEAFNKLCQENETLKQKNTALTNEINSMRLSHPEMINGFYVYFTSDPDMQSARNLALESAKEYKGISAVFCGSDVNYRYAIASNDVNLAEFASLLRTRLSAKGGGSPELLQGSLPASRENIIEFLEQV